MQPKVLNKYNLQGESGIIVIRPSKFGNPFKKDSLNSRNVFCDLYEKWIQTQPELIEQVKQELAGKNLVCCCAPKRCHAETLLRITNNSDLNDFFT